MSDDNFETPSESYKFLTSDPGVPYLISEAQYFYMLEVLPPIYGNGCFAVGEPSDFVDGKTTYHWAAKIHEKYWACYGHKAQAEAGFQAIR